MAEPVMALVSVASNIAPEEHIPRALEALDHAVGIDAVSTFHVTAPIGRPDQPPYYNGAVRLRHEGGARRLKFDTLRPIEGALGRVRGADPYAARTIDLDVLVYGLEAHHDDDLRVPDPDLLERPFLAAAAAELAPDLVPPGMHAPLNALTTPERRAGLTPALDFSRRMKERYNHE
jgi:2-amino-4-hydroxy-6-hydroxymethyldihydropteridine diphosphokinase